LFIQVVRNGSLVGMSWLFLVSAVWFSTDAFVVYLEFFTSVWRVVLTCFIRELIDHLIFWVIARISALSHVEYCIWCISGLNRICIFFRLTLWHDIVATG
jgi:hypothetical protein